MNVVLIGQIFSFLFFQRAVSPSSEQHSGREYQRVSADLRVHEDANVIVRNYNSAECRVFFLFLYGFKLPVFE